MANPFRKSRPEDRVLALSSLDTTPAATPPPPVSFRKPPAPSPKAIPKESPLPSAIVVDGKRRRSDVVKKVRVVSPPESPMEEEKGFWPVPAQQPQQQPQQSTGEQVAMVNNGGFPSVEDLEMDPFAAAKARKLERETAAAAATQQEEQQQQQPQPEIHQPQPLAPGQIPANPFQKTLHDLEEDHKTQELHHQEEEEGAALKAGNLAKGSLDVGAFQRLLMTGRAEGTSSPLPTKSQIVSDLAGEVSSSSASSSPYNGSVENLSSIPQPKIGSALAHEVPQSDDDDDDEDEGSISDSSVSVQTEKRAPPPPTSRHGKSIKQQISGPNTHSAEAAPARKAVPGPPPPRGHSRSDSKATAASAALNPNPAGADEEPVRTSTDSQHSHKAHAPAPPPPRRPHLHQSGSSTLTAQTVSSPAMPSPALSTVASSEHDTMAGDAPDKHVESQEQVKSPAAPPPPPPARHGSARRTGTKRPTPAGGTPVKENAVPAGAPPPPPPPARKRGSSKGSLDRPGGGGAPGQVAEEQGKGTDILADLEALQREVDAMRGRIS